ncbi:hypothetical protein L3X38_001376 [Prunus dulcis]|uniref:Uncharacterized protein n=1 Tax=Prunus dulcis TaxID=3755 RepID=A0AAD4ZJU9_PRUDU|nr:hypothetical protein L3X38_001376 [Prunus dulcis]
MLMVWPINKGSAFLVLTTLDKVKMEYVIHFNFRTSNNEAYYEALLARQISIHSESQLVVNQVTTDFAIKDAYTVINDVLYKRGYTTPYLKCITVAQEDYVLREIHGGVCGDHSGYRSLAYEAF